MKGSRQSAKKSLGQHFLCSGAVARRIVEAAEPVTGELIFEIGPGTGALTGPLAQSGAMVVAYEIDAGLAGRLGEELRNNENVDVVHADVRVIDFEREAAKRGRGRYKIVGNIPFHLTSTILFDLPRWSGMVKGLLMVQREVGERICTLPGDRNCGIMTVYLCSYFDIGKVLVARPGSFRPRPKVESVVLGFTPKAVSGGPYGREEFLEFLKLAFSQRRKKLRSVLRGSVRLDIGGGTAVDELFGQSLDRRAEELELNDWYALFDRYREVRKRT